MYDKIKNFRDLEVWKLGTETVIKTYKVTSSFPKEELFGLVSQMRKCAVSIPSNVAEGYNRFHNKEYKQFLYVALGSCAELETQVEISSNLKFIEERNKYELLEILNHLSYN
ncbi:MAG: four helix bundle protein [Patescibacteria group bacterium]